MLVQEEWLLTPFRAAVHVPSATAVVADLHLGYDALRRESGEAIPDMGWLQTRKRLDELINRHQIARLIVAGDLIENARRPEAAHEVAQWLYGLGIAFELVPGNHDRGLPPVTGLTLWPRGRQLSRWTILHHGDLGADTPCITGHIHPVLRHPRLSGRAACYLVRAGHIVLPAFSDDAAGLNVANSQAWRDYEGYVVAGKDVVGVGLVGRLRHGAIRDKG